MADQQKSTPTPDPLVTLTEDARKELEKLQADVDASYEYIKTMEELGLDTSRLKQNLDTAVKIRDAALRLFKAK